MGRVGILLIVFSRTKQPLTCFADAVKTMELVTGYLSKSDRYLKLTANLEIIGMFLAKVTLIQEYRESHIEGFLIDMHHIPVFMSRSD